MIEEGQQKHLPKNHFPKKHLQPLYSVERSAYSSSSSSRVCLEAGENCEFTSVRQFSVCSVDRRIEGFERSSSSAGAIAIRASGKKKQSDDRCVVRSFAGTGTRIYEVRASKRSFPTFLRLRGRDRGEGERADADSFLRFLEFWRRPRLLRPRNRENRLPRPLESNIDVIAGSRFAGARTKAIREEVLETATIMAESWKCRGSGFWYRRVRERCFRIWSSYTILRFDRGRFPKRLLLRTTVAHVRFGY